MVSEYALKLKDPRWQRRRLEIMQRDDFACQKCSAKTDTLHVHHRFYIYGRSPWEYPDNALVTLCLNCHEEEGQGGSVPKDAIQSLHSTGMWNTDFKILTEFFSALDWNGHDIAVAMEMVLNSEAARKSLIKLLGIIYLSPTAYPFSSRNFFQSAKHLGQVVCETNPINRISFPVQSATLSENTVELGSFLPGTFM